MHATDFPAVGFGKVVPRLLRRHALLTALFVAAPYAGSLAGAFLLVAAYRSATGVTELRTFHLFWLGILVFLVPTAYRLLGFAASRGERMALVAATGGFLFIPKVLRDPNGPVYFDELAHWRQSEDLRITGELFTPNSIVHFAQFFPGLDSVDVALHRLTGLSTFATGTAMLAVVHVAALLGVFRLGERILGSARLGALAALVYGLNTSFMFFDSQYSYESLGFLFFIWSLVCAVEALATPPSAARVGWVAGALASAGACCVTHHLTSYYLTAALAFVTVAAIVVARRPGRAARQALATVACITLAVAACACAWVVIVTPDIVGYFATADPPRGRAGRRHGAALERSARALREEHLPRLRAGRGVPRADVRIRAGHERPLGGPASPAEGPGTARALRVRRGVLRLAAVHPDAGRGRGRAAQLGLHVARPLPCRGGRARRGRGLGAPVRRGCRATRGHQRDSRRSSP